MTESAKNACIPLVAERFAAACCLAGLFVCFSPLAGCLLLACLACTGHARLRSALQADKVNGAFFVVLLLAVLAGHLLGLWRSPLELLLVSGFLSAYLVPGLRFRLGPLAFGAAALGLALLVDSSLSSLSQAADLTTPLNNLKNVFDTGKGLIRPAGMVIGGTTCINGLHQMVKSGRGGNDEGEMGKGGVKAVVGGAITGVSYFADLSSTTMTGGTGQW